MIEVDVRMTLDDLNTCLTALGKLPLEHSLQTWAKLKAAGEKALEAARQPVVPDEKKEGAA